MCMTCGCGDDDAPVRVTAVAVHPHPHEHAHAHDHAHPHPHERDSDRDGPTDPVAIEQRLLAKNDRLASAVREMLARRGIRALNLMSSPGSGKTSLLERTIGELGRERPICVIEGDQETAVDADRIARAGARAVQVNTGAGCHLDADMVRRAIDVLDPPDSALLFVENVGNLVCPALFDVGESAKVVVVSVTEGDDKPLKYPHMFAAADLVIVNKTDLLPYVDFDLDRLAKQACALSPTAIVAPMSVRTGDGVDAWYAWLGTVAPSGVGARSRAQSDVNTEGVVRGAAVGT